MEVGIISQIEVLDTIPNKLHYCYSSLLNYPTYRDFYMRRRALTILDTSPSLPRKVSLDLFFDGIKVISPAYVVLPSYDYSSEKTISVAKVCLSKLNVKNVVGTVQGYDLESIRECYNFLRDYCNIIGLPSPLETVGKREEIIRDVGIKEPVLYIEVYKNPVEEIPPLNSIGICTSYPVRLAVDYRGLQEYTPTPPPLNFSQSREKIPVELIKSNISEYLEVIKYARGRITKVHAVPPKR